jgi:hypothetical protein
LLKIGSSFKNFGCLISLPYYTENWAIDLKSGTFAGETKSGPENLQKRRLPDRFEIDRIRYLSGEFCGKIAKTTGGHPHD